MLWTLIVLLVTVTVAASEALPSQDGMFKEPDVLQPAPNNLRYVYIIFRHGIRTALYQPFPTDPNQDKELTWPEGVGSLTQAGKQLMRHVGKALRSRYHSFIPAYDPHTVVVSASEMLRAVESARLVVEGMFNRRNTLVTYDPLDHHEIFDEVINNTSCPTYVALRDQALREEREMAPRRRRDFYRRLTTAVNIPGAPSLVVDTLEELFRVFDTITMEKLNNRPYVNWANQLMPEMQTLAQMRMWLFMNAKPGMLQFYTGTMLYRIFKEMDEAREGREAVKLHLHGSHDSTLGAVFWALSLTETYYAWPGDTLMVELYNDDTVQLFHYSPLKEATLKRFEQVSLKPLCGKDSCPLEDLRHKVTVLDEDQWKARCHEPLDVLSKWRQPPTTL